MASTPAMVVVLTAPRPTSRIPSLPRAGAIESGEVTIADYIMGKMRMFLRRPVAGQDPLPVSMTGARAGERVLQVGGDDPALAGLLAAKPGLNGHAAIVVATEERQYLYQVTSVQTVLPSEVSVLAPTPEATCTLITCVPDRIYSHRLIVQAKLA